MTTLETNLTAPNTSECSPFETKRYVIVALVSAGSGTLSALAAITVLFLMIMLKKYIFFVQRLIFYLCLAGLFNAIAIVFRFQQVKDFETHIDSDTGPLHILCVASAFIEQMSAWSLHIAFCCVTFNLLLTAVFKRDTERLELLYVGLIFLLPITFCWIPFIQDSYGDAGAWCWIRGLNNDCDIFLFGTYLRFFLWYIPTTILLIAVVVVYIFIIVWVTWQRRRWVGKYDPETERQKENLQKEVWPLLFYPLGFLVLNVFSLINRIQDAIQPDRPVYALWILHGLFFPMQGGYIALNYLLSKDTRKSLSCMKIKATLCHKEATITEYPVDTGATDSWSEARVAQERGKIKNSSVKSVNAISPEVHRPSNEGVDSLPEAQASRAQDKERSDPE